MITINQFLEEYGVHKGHLAQFGLTYYHISTYGDIELDSLPVDIHIAFMAVLARYGHFCDCDDRG